MSEGTEAVLGARRAREAADIHPGLSAALTRPDGRCIVRPDGDWTPGAAFSAAALARRRGGPVVAHVGESQAEARSALSAAGFDVARREAVIAFEVATALEALEGAWLPAGMEARSAVDVDEDALRLLDDELRQDVPGAEGWRSTPEEFRRQSFDDPEFDPRTYLVAADPAGLVGIVRIWMNRSVPRLGFVGVRRAHRRRGIGAALLRYALGPVADTGAEVVTAEHDLTNVASRALLERLGASRLGTTVELVYDPGAASRGR